DIFPGRLNSAGVDLADPLVREPLLDALDSLEGRTWEAVPTHGKGGKAQPITSPTDGSTVGHCSDATKADIDLAFERAAAVQPGWDARGGIARAELLEEAARLYEAHTAEFISLCQREAGK